MTLLKQKIGDIVGAVTVPSQTITASDRATVGYDGKKQARFSHDTSTSFPQFPKTYRSTFACVHWQKYQCA
jgi:hypothetical protein